MIHHDCLIIGGGASGLLSAIVAKDNGCDVAIIEGKNRVAKKLLITGNGRCNFSNKFIMSPYENYHSINDDFYKHTLDKLTVDDTVNLFYTLGLKLTEIDGKLYPQSLQASSVVDILRLNIEERNIPVYLNNKVNDIIYDNGFLVKTELDNFSSSRILIACGGNVAPNTGSDGSIYNIMKRFNHRIIKPLPAIVQLKLNYKYLKGISGVRFDALAKVFVNKEEIKSDFGEVLFTDYGISGPAILQISRYASIGLDRNENVKIVLDLFPDKSQQELKAFFEAHFSIFTYRSVMDSLISILNKKLIPRILKDSGIDNIHKTCDQLEYYEKINFYKLLKHWEFNCFDTNGFKNAQATIGGIDTTDINERTLESKLIKGLFFAGEALDVDGDCGGYNLQWAWSSGYLAGINISKR